MYNVCISIRYDDYNLSRNKVKASQIEKFSQTMIFIECYLKQVAAQSNFHNVLHNKLSIEVEKHEKTNIVTCKQTLFKLYPGFAFFLLEVLLILSIFFSEKGIK